MICPKCGGDLHQELNKCGYETELVRVTYYCYNCNLMLYDFKNSKTLKNGSKGEYDD